MICLHEGGVGVGVFNIDSTQREKVWSVYMKGGGGGVYNIDSTQREKVWSSTQVDMKGWGCIA